MSEESKTENTGAEQQADTTDWKAKFESADKRAKTFEGKLADVEKKLEGYDPDKVAKWQADSEALANLERQGAIAGSEEERNAYIEAEISKRETAIRNESQKALDEYSSENKSLKEQLHELRVVNTAMDHFNGSVVEGAGEHIKNIIRQNLSIDDDGIFVKGADGKPRFKQGNQRMTVDDFKAEVMEKSPFFFQPTKQAGSYNGNKAANTGPITLEKYLALTPEERNANPIREFDLKLMRKGR